MNLQVIFQIVCCFSLGLGKLTMRRCVVRSHCCVTYGTLMMCVFTNKIVTFSPTVSFPELIFLPKKDSHNCACKDINQIIFVKKVHYIQWYSFVVE